MTEKMSTTNKRWKCIKTKLKHMLTVKSDIKRQIVFKIVQFLYSNALTYVLYNKHVHVYTIMSSAILIMVPIILSLMGQLKMKLCLYITTMACVVHNYVQVSEVTSCGIICWQH